MSFRYIVNKKGRYGLRPREYSGGRDRLVGWRAMNHAERRRVSAGQGPEGAWSARALRLQATARCGLRSSVWVLALRHRRPAGEDGEQRDSHQDTCASCCL